MSAGDRDRPVTAAPAAGRRTAVLAAVLLLLLAALLLWAASRVTWLDVTAYNDQSGAARRLIVGSAWQPALVPLALGSVAGVAAVALVRGTAARLVGVVLLLLGIAGSALVPGALGAVDTDRVHSVVTSSDGGTASTSSGRTGTQGAADQPLPPWSEVTAVDTRLPGPVLTGLAASALAAAGLLLMARPPAPVARDGRYLSPAARREKSAKPAVERGMWESLDAGEDPTV